MMFFPKCMWALSIIFLALPLSGQHSLTIGEVYDYDIGDTFHYITKMRIGFTPNADRYRVISKNYSTNRDTVSYLMHQSGYTSFRRNPTEELTYNFYERTISRIYTHLDAPIHAWGEQQQAMWDTVIYSISAKKGENAA